MALAGLPALVNLADLWAGRVTSGAYGARAGRAQAGLGSARGREQAKARPAGPQPARGASPEGRQARAAPRGSVSSSSGSFRTRSRKNATATTAAPATTEAAA